MARFVRYLDLKDNTENWGLVNSDVNFLKIHGDRYTSYTVTDEVVDPAAVKILPPSKPTKIVAVGLNYRDHAEEMKLRIPEEPVLFIKTTNTLIGHGDSIVLPAMSAQVDYEAELAIIIKNDIKDIDEEAVVNNILGYTCYNDVTARDLQRKDSQWTRAKCFDTFGPCGPYFTSHIDPDNCNIRLFVNGVQKQVSNTSNFIFKTRHIVSYISRIMTLYRGDIITTGTPAGIGPLKAGDTVEVGIEGIGMLRNTVKKAE